MTRGADTCDSSEVEKNMDALVTDHIWTQLEHRAQWQSEEAP